MSSKSLRRLDLRLPHDHPIYGFDVEARQRAKIARDWLDTGARIAGLEASVYGLDSRVGDMNNKISGIEKQLYEIKEMLSGEAVKVQTESPAPQLAENKTKVNIAKMFENMFGGEDE